MIEGNQREESEVIEIVDVNQQEMADLIQEIPVESQQEQDLLEKVLRFDENAMPPKLDLAMVHYKCNKFGQEKISFDVETFNFCACCGSMEQAEYNLTDPTDSFDFYGPTMPLFFHLAKMLSLLSLLYGLAGLYVQVNIFQENTRVRPDLPAMDRIFNTNSMDKETYYTKAANFIFPCLWIFTVVYYFFIHDKQTRLADKIKKKRPTASDYTIMIHNIEPHEQKFDYILGQIKKRIFLNSIGESVNIEIERINYGMFEGNLIRHEIKIRKNKVAIEALEAKLSSEVDPKLKTSFENKLKSARKILADYIKSYEKYKKICETDKEKGKFSIAFVTLANPTQARLINPVTTQTYVLSRMFPCFYREKVHIILPAHEPDDIKWKFIGYSPFDTFWSVVCSYTWYSLTVLISFVIQLGIKLFQSWWSSSVTPKISSNPRVLTMLNLPFISSFAVNVLNFLVILITSKLTRAERHLSNSDMILSHARKLIWLQFFNSAGFPVALWILAHTDRFSELLKNYTQVDTISKHVLSMLITNMFLNPIMHIVSPGHLYKIWWTRRRIQQDLEAERPVNLTQKDLNMMYDPEDPSLHVRYASLVRTYFVSCFFFDILPIGMVICFGFMVFQFWVDKYMILRRYRRIPRLHQELAYGAAQIAEFGGFLFVLGHMLFKYRKILVFENQENYQSSTKLIDLLFTALAFLFPLLSMRMILISEKDDEEIDLGNNTDAFNQSIEIDPSLQFELMHREGREIPFKEIWVDLDIDYDRKNPLTREEALKRWKKAKMGTGVAELPDPADNNQRLEETEKQEPERNTEEITAAAPFRTSRIESIFQTPLVTTESKPVDLSEATQSNVEPVETGHGSHAPIQENKTFTVKASRQGRGTNQGVSGEGYAGEDDEIMNKIVNIRMSLYSGKSFRK